MPIRPNPDNPPCPYCGGRTIDKSVVKGPNPVRHRYRCKVCSRGHVVTVKPPDKPKPPRICNEKWCGRPAEPGRKKCSHCIALWEESLYWSDRHAPNHVTMPIHGGEILYG